MIISVVQKKHLTKVNNQSQLKFRKVEKKGNFFSLIWGIYENPTGNIILNDESLKFFPLSSRTRQECLLSALLLRIILDALAIANGQEKERKGIQIGKEEVKLSLFTNSLTF